MASIFTFQCEAYGLNQGQRQNGAGVVNAWLSGKSFTSANVDPDYTKRGVTYLFVEINEVASKAEGDDLFETVRAWLATRSTDFPDGTHSYVRLADKNRTTLINTIYRAESPSWVALPPETHDLRTG